MISAADALEQLRRGNRRFVAATSGEDPVIHHSHVAGAAAAQAPFAIILACSDSRVPTELIFDQGIGALFVIRVAGNIVAPSQIGSIEYAAKQFGTKLVVVLGHSNCGVVTATLDELALKESHRSPNLRAIVDRVRPAIEVLLENHDGEDIHSLLPAAIRANVHTSVDQLRHGSLIIEGLVENDELLIVGAEYSIEDGTVTIFDAAAT